MLSNWADESCMDTICRPNLITVRDSNQVSRPGELLLGRTVHTKLHELGYTQSRMQTHNSPVHIFAFSSTR